MSTNHRHVNRGAYGNRHLRGTLRPYVGERDLTFMAFAYAYRDCQDLAFTGWNARTAKSRNSTKRLHKKRARNEAKRDLANRVAEAFDDE